MKYCNFCKILIPSLLFVGLCFWLTYQFVEPAPSNIIHIAAGREGSAYYHFAEKYQTELAKSGVELVIHPTAGTLKSLELLYNGKAQLALVQSGASKASPLQFDVPPEALAALAYEPIWVFHAADQTFNYLFDFKAKRVVIGEEGSGTQALARRLLAHNDVNAENSTLLTMSDDEAIQALENHEVDALFLVSPLQSENIQSLLHKEGIKLFNFARADAYAQAYPHLNRVSLSEGVIDFAHNIPNENKTLVAVTTTLVANADLDDIMVRLLLREARKIHQKQFNYDRNTVFPQPCCSDMDFRVAAVRYLEKGDSWTERLLPFWLATLIDRLLIMLLPLLTIIPIAFKIFPSLYRYQVRYRIYRWYGRLTDLDAKAHQILNASDAVPTDQLKELILVEQALLDIESKANETTNVPLSYMGEFYTLRTHMQLVLARLQDYKERIQLNI